MDSPLEAVKTNSRIVAAYRARTQGSAELAREAAALLPSGITHDARHIDPYGIYVTHAEGPRKWDVDGNEYVDYFGGHGALLLGHLHPTVSRAVEAALAAGTHFGANHPGEVRWAAAVRRLVPFAERLRFTSSGTEATLMAVRLARAAEIVADGGDTAVLERHVGEVVAALGRVDHPSALYHQIEHRNPCRFTRSAAEAWRSRPGGASWP